MLVLYLLLGELRGGLGLSLGHLDYCLCFSSSREKAPLLLETSVSRPEHFARSPEIEPRVLFPHLLSACFCEVGRSWSFNRSA